MMMMNDMIGAKEGQSIKARLKPQSSVKHTTAMNSDSIAYTPNNVSIVDGSSPPDVTAFKNVHKSKPAAGSGNSSSSHKNAVNGRNNNGRHATNSNQSHNNRNNNRPFTRPRSPPSNKTNYTNKLSNAIHPSRAMPPPPQFHASQFPSLLSDNEHLLTDNKTLSSSSSLLNNAECNTTTTDEPLSSKENNNAVTTGYAAALLKTSSSATAPIALKVCVTNVL